MPRYYFHVRSKHGREVDVEGIEFDSLEEAIKDARRAGAGIVADQGLEGRLEDPDSLFEIADMSGTILAEVPFILRDGSRDS